MKKVLTKQSRDVLIKLIDKYERAGRHRLAPLNNRRVILSFTKSYPKGYLKGIDYTIKEGYNASCRELEHMGYIDIDWVPNKDIINKVYLKEDLTTDAYQLLQRTPLMVRENKLLDLLAKARAEASVSWLKTFFCKTMNLIKEQGSYRQYLDPNDLQLANKLISALLVLPTITEETMKRRLSIQLYKDSKTFESLETRLVTILKESCPTVRELELEDNKQILSLFNVMSNPQWVHISGDIVIKVGENTIHLKDLSPGIALPAPIISQLEVIKTKARRIITIENLSSYNEFALNNTDDIAIYLGGFHNTVARNAILKMPNDVPIYHWGDIDAGGFAILKHLRQRTGRSIESWLMDKDTLNLHLQYAKNLSASEIARLKKLATDEYLTNETDVILTMVEVKKKLEQEAISR